MDHGLKTDERPWDHGEDADDLHDASTLRCESRPHRREAAVVPAERDGEYGDHAREEHPGEDRMKPDCEPLAEEAHRAAEGNGEDAKRNFSEVHVKPC